MHNSLADYWLAIHYIFAIQGDNQPEAPMHRGMVRTHIQQHGFGFGFEPCHKITSQFLDTAKGVFYQEV